MTETVESVSVQRSSWCALPRTSSCSPTRGPDCSLWWFKNSGDVDQKAQRTYVGCNDGKFEYEIAVPDPKYILRLGWQELANMFCSQRQAAGVPTDALVIDYVRRCEIHGLQ